MSWMPVRLEKRRYAVVGAEEAVYTLWPGESAWPMGGYRPTIVGLVGAILTYAITRNPLYALGGAAAGALGYLAYEAVDQSMLLTPPATCDPTKFACTPHK